MGVKNPELHTRPPIHHNQVHAYYNSNPNSWSAITWYGVEFCCYIAIILYVLSYFGVIKRPRQRDNVIENTNEAWNNTGDFMANAASIAKKINTVFADPQPPTTPPGKDK